MRTCLRISVALLVALALSSPLGAQTLGDPRVSLNASVGPSFANVGTTFSANGSLDVAVTDRLALVGEFGILPHAPFADAGAIAPPAAADGDGLRVNAYHWNGNLRVRPFEIGNAFPYVTAGFGMFTADAVSDSRTVGGLSVQDRRRVSDVATNLGAGLSYRLTDWVAANADYRTFFVHRGADDPRVHRFTTGLTFSLR